MATIEKPSGRTDFKSLFYKKGENLVGDLVGANGEIIEDDVNKAEHMFNKILGGIK